VCSHPKSKNKNFSTDFSTEKLEARRKWRSLQEEERICQPGHPSPVKMPFKKRGESQDVFVKADPHQKKHFTLLADGMVSERRPTVQEGVKSSKKSKL
jgi:hypothetical protein